MLESLQALDRTVFLALNGMHTPYLDSFMYIFTSKLVWIPLYASILYVLYKNMNIRMVIFTTLMFALLIALADQTCSSLLRPIFERPRPSRNPDIADMVHLVNGKRGGKFGFPSCHAANTFALACFMMLLFRQSLNYILYAMGDCNLLHEGVRGSTLSRRSTFRNSCRVCRGSRHLWNIPFLSSGG